MNKKTIYLFLALLVPVLIFIFLKFFGKNQFDIPIYYQNGVDSLSAVCNSQFSKPYVLPDSILRRGEGEYASATLISFDSSFVAKKFISGVMESFDDHELGLIDLNGNGQYSLQQIDRLKNCVLMLGTPWTVVLVDKQKRIRGYYHPVTQEETDRMMVELKILLKKY